MAHHCRECGEGIRWDATVCERCGEENPLGREPGDLALMGILGISGAGLVAWLGYFLFKILRAATGTH
jgi:hypothetical protein